MTQKKVIISILIGILVIAVVFFFDIKKTADNDSSNDKVNITYFVANKNWETGLEKKVFFKKGDKLEYTYIIRNDSSVSKKINIATGDVASKLGLQDVSIVVENNIVSAGDSVLITIVGKTISDGSTSDKLNVVSFENASASDINSGNNIAKSTSGSNTNSNIQGVNPSSVSSTPTSQTQIVSNTGTNNTGVNTSTSQTTGNVVSDSVNFERTTIVSRIGNLIRVSGAGVGNIKNIGIGDKIFSVFKSDNGSSYFHIPQDTFSQGEYFAFTVSQTDKITALNQTFKFIGSENKDLFVVDILPKKISNKTASWVVLQGSGFKSIISVQLSNNIIFQDTEFKIISDQILAIKVPENIAAGEYFFNVMTLKGIFNLSENKFYIVDKK